LETVINITRVVVGWRKSGTREIAVDIVATTILVVIENIVTTTTADTVAEVRRIGLTATMRISTAIENYRGIYAANILRCDDVVLATTWIVVATIGIVQ
jgi:hypothetical protein